MAKQQEKNQRTQIFKIITIGATILFVIMYGVALFQTKPTKKETVKTYKIKKADPYVFEGSVDAKRTEKVSIDPSKGKLTGTLVSDGELVRRGQILLRYKNTSITSQIPSQEKVVTRAHRAYKNAYAAYLKVANKKKKTDLDKETLSGLKDTLDSTRDAYNDSVDALNNLENHRYNRVRSTISGYVSINENAKDDNTLPYLTITSDKVEVVGSVSEYDYSKLKQGDKVTIDVISNNQKIKGTISKIDKVPTSASSLDASSLTSSDSSASYNFYVTPEEEIQYGYSVEISLPVNEIQVPKKYIKKGSDSYYTYVYKNKKKIKTDVTVKETSDYYIVQSGLNVNDKVVIR